MEQAKERADLQSVIEEFCHIFEVEHAVYHWVNSKGAHMGVGTYPQSWINRYLQKGYLKIDPVIVGGFQSYHPMDCKKLDWSSKHARVFQADAIANGVGNQGWSIPLRGPRGQYALFTVSHNCAEDVWAKFIKSRRRDLILISYYFNNKALELEPEKLADVASALSPREIETLTLLAMGYNRAMVAQTLSISEHTVRVYVASARFKLGSMNTTHAVASALSRGLIVILSHSSQHF